MEAQELGDIDGVQMWWCPTCGAMTPALKRNKAPALKHADGCGKSKVEDEQAPTPTPTPIVHPLDTLKAPTDSSEQ